MKSYVKPELFMEHFELSQQVAACRWDLNQADKNSCTASFDSNMNNRDDGSMYLFTDRPRCSVMEGDAPSYCYFLGSQDTEKLFQS